MTRIPGQPASLPKDRVRIPGSPDIWLNRSEWIPSGPSATRTPRFPPVPTFNNSMYEAQPLPRTNPLNTRSDRDLGVFSTIALPVLLCTLFIVITHLVFPRPVPTAVPSTQGMVTYHGGGVLSDPTIYAIYWGNSSQFPADLEPGMTAFLSHLNGTPYLSELDQYVGKASIRFAGNLYDASPTLTSDPSDSTIEAEVDKVLAKNGKQRDSSALYLVFTSSGPFSSNFCAWHSSSGSQLFSSSPPISFAYIPNTICNISTMTTSYTEVTQSIVNSTSHEIVEAMSDPNGHGWIGPNGNEIGDLCESDLTTVTLNSSAWNLQKIWSDDSNSCSSG